MNASGGRVGSDAVVRSFPPVPLAEAVATVGGQIRGDDATLVADVVVDHREVIAGSVFCCVPGATADGHDFAAAAVDAGAAALMVERWLDVDVAQVRVASVRAAMGSVSAAVYGRPAEALTTAGVTGTNGKTTSTYLLESVFETAGMTSGLIGTTGARIAGRPSPLAHTTPEAPDLQRLFASMRDAGVSAVAMEVSSHALAQHRVDGIVFDVATFTNLSQDHLDYHPSMEAYFEAKARLFTPALARAGVVNVDDRWGRRLAELAEVPVTTYALDTEADVRATEVRSDVRGVSFRCEGILVRSTLRGRFNVTNCLGVLAAARSLGIDPARAAEGIERAPMVPGRMEPIDEGQDFLVVVDYAHTPDSILGVLRASRPLAAGRVIVVFGCGGDRDRAKRPEMGRAATSLADHTIITSDNPRSEDPLAIIREIERGAADGGGAYVIEPDRRAAIGLAIDQARPGDVVVIAGKGHETVQELAGGSLPFDDRDVARAALRSEAR